MIDTSSAVNHKFLECCKAIVEKTKQPLNQEANAIAGWNCLKQLGFSVVNEAGEQLDKDERAEVLGLFKKLGNASANRQAMEGKKVAAAQSLVPDEWLQ